MVLGSIFECRLKAVEGNYGCHLFCHHCQIQFKHRGFHCECSFVKLLHVTCVYTVPLQAFSWVSTYRFTSARSANSINMLKQFQKPNRVRMKAPNWEKNLRAFLRVAAAMAQDGGSIISFLGIVNESLFWIESFERFSRAILRWHFFLFSFSFRMQLFNSTIYANK